MTLPITKIYVDSKFMTPDSESSSNFKFPLNRNIFLPDDTVFLIDEISIPHSWYSIEENINDKLYIKWHGLIGGIEATLYRKVVIPYGQYSGSEFALALGIALNETLPTNELSPTYYAKKNTIILNHNLNTYDYKLYSDYELKNGAVWIPASDVHSIDRDNLHSVNDVIRNYGITKSYGGANLYVSGFLDLSNFHNIYISSPNLGSFSTMGARGEAGIIRKIPVTSDYG